MTKRVSRSACVYAVILLTSWAHSLTAKGDVGPPYPSNGASVFVPFVNANELSDPSQYVSPQIRVGFKLPNATYTNPAFDVTMDTGSVGIVVGSSYFNPPANGRLDPSFIGPGSETLTSSGIIFSGDWYITTVNLYNGNAVVASSTVPVMAVTKVSCEPNARECDPSTIGATAPTTHYFGIGFAGGAGQPQGTPDKNAFLNVTSISGSASQLSPGYILSTQGVEIGLTSGNTQGFALIKLEPLLAPDSTQWQTAPASANVLTDWQHPRGTITVNGSSGSGSILFDTGVSTGFLTPPIGVTLQTGMGPENAECNGSTPPSCAVQGSSVQVSFPSLSIPPSSNRPAPVASLHYTVGANNGSQSGNPVSPFAVSVEHNSAPFLNTTVRFLQAFNYFYDAANGFLGLQTTGKTPAQYATSTSSGLAIQGVFQCFFSWAVANFCSQSFNFSDPTFSDHRPNTRYSWPYTYQSNIGISSGSPQAGNTPATVANYVYILAGGGGQSTS